MKKDEYNPCWDETSISRRENRLSLWVDFDRSRAMQQLMQLEAFVWRVKIVKCLIHMLNIVFTLSLYITTRSCQCTGLTRGVPIYMYIYIYILPCSVVLSPLYCCVTSLVQMCSLPCTVVLSHLYCCVTSLVQMCSLPYTQYYYSKYFLESY